MGRTPDEFAEDAAFEQEVVRVAIAVYATHHPYQGARVVDGRERDGVIEGDDVVVAIEATTSRTVDKARKDGEKLRSLCEKLSAQHRYKAIKGFLVTKDDPTAQQREVVAALKAPVTICSFAQFQSQLIDSRDYLTARAAYQFGSARNPGNGSVTELEPYVSIGFMASPAGDRGRMLGIEDLLHRVTEGETTVLLGDFGAGKSMTLRELHLKLQSRHFKDPLAPFPLTLNLRDHQGQQDPDEAIRRHASRIGFDAPGKLVRAWRAGHVHVLLDGFDEIASTGWRGRTPNLKQIRRNSVEVVRRFAEETPQGVGLIVSGRRHFFDTEAEMLSSLGLVVRSPQVALTDQFTDEQVEQYLRAHTWVGLLPDWLPNHPLLLGHLASTKALRTIADGDARDPATGWDLLLDLICEREAGIEQGLDGATIRKVLERLATLARSRSDGMGPIFPTDLALSFEQVAGYTPDEGSYQVLQRLPGLGVNDASDGSRVFIDESLVDAARSSDVVRYALGLESILESAVASIPLRSLGVGVAVLQAGKTGLTSAQAFAAAKRLAVRGGTDAIVLDLLRIGIELGGTPPGSFELTGLDIDELTMDNEDDDLGALSFRTCLVSVLDLSEHDGSRPIPYFESCAIGVVKGAASAAGLPAGRFKNCSFEAFDPSSRTTRGILGMPGLRPRQKVMLTVLKKVYAQSGSGRKQSALYRGLDPSLRGEVPQALAALESSGLLTSTRVNGTTIYLPVRGQRSRVRAFLESPATVQDPLIRDA